MSEQLSAPIKIDSILVHRYRIPLKTPFRISAGRINEKEGVIIELQSGGITGWGEVSVDAVPFYAHETCGSACDLIDRAFRPLLLGKTFQTPESFVREMDSFRGGNFTKAGLDAAFWDVYGKYLGRSVSSLIGGTRKYVESGPSIGIKECPAHTLKTVENVLKEGWRRIKLKVCPGADYEFIRAVRKEFPEISLMVDANNAYGVQDFQSIARWDEFGLLMIEQPLNEEDIYFHSRLKEIIKTPICLDESIHSFAHAQAMIAMNAADILNVKVCRVGGICNAMKMIDLCENNGIGCWVGSRVGSGVGDAARLAVASLRNCIYPSDCVISGMYMADDILTKPFSIENGHMIRVGDAPGLGIEVDRDKLLSYRLRD